MNESIPSFFTREKESEGHVMEYQVVVKLKCVSWIYYILHISSDIVIESLLFLDLR